MDDITLAERVATEAHAGQPDKARRPYIDHPRGVAARVTETTNDPDAVVVAWLHDVVEDSGITLDKLREMGFSERVVDAVDALTRRKTNGQEEGDDYYRRVAASDLAYHVKQADIRDNEDPERTILLDPATREALRLKYEHARERLQHYREMP